MYHIVYLSEVVGELSEAELRELLVRWRRKNAQLDVTGLLLYSQGQVLQVLEGGRQPIEQLFEQIAADCRHTAVVKLADGPTTRREFADWSMGFLVSAPEEFAKLAGYRNPTAPEFLAAPARLSPPILELLRDFATIHLQQP